MSSLSIALPITKDSADGFTMIKSFENLVKQNLKMLIFTMPGERVMYPEFGVGVKRFLFSHFQSDIRSAISSEIYTQVNRYIPIITINDIAFLSPDSDNNSLSFKIIYSIPSIGSIDLLELTI
tara:strand:+ start:26 stop:394 length:369 start_codon:yes stop_codon:yes gene_type:complete